MTEATRTAMQEAAAAIGNYPAYSLKTAADGTSRFSCKYSTAYQAAADYCQQFIDGLAGLNETEKVIPRIFMPNMRDIKLWLIFRADM